MLNFIKKMIPGPTKTKISLILQKIDRFLGMLTSFVFNRLLPDRTKMGIKSAINVIKKMDYDKHDIYLNVNSIIEYEIRTRSCKKEPEIVKWIENSFQPGDVLFDIGANVGAYSLVAAKFHKGAIKIYSFEPSFSTFAQLSRNIFVNNCQEFVVPLQIALSDKTTIGPFYYTNIEPGYAMHSFGDSLDFKGDYFKPAYFQNMLSYKVDDLVKIFPIPAPTHIKVDVDGIEFKVLQGARKILESPNFKSLFIELEEGDAEAEQIIKFLNEIGLNFVSKHKYTAIDDKGPFSKMYNYIFEKTKTSRNSTQSEPQIISKK